MKGVQFGSELGNLSDYFKDLIDFDEPEESLHIEINKEDTNSEEDSSSEEKP